jgi:hypothetical protein
VMKLLLLVVAGGQQTKIPKRGGDDITGTLRNTSPPYNLLRVQKNKECIGQEENNVQQLLVVLVDEAR